MRFVAIRRQHPRIFFENRTTKSVERTISCVLGVFPQLFQIFHVSEFRFSIRGLFLDSRHLVCLCACGVLCQKVTVFEEKIVVNYSPLELAKLAIWFDETSSTSETQ